MAKAFDFMLSIYNSFHGVAMDIIDFFSTNIAWPDWAGNAPLWWPAFSVGELVFGAGLVGLLIFIIVKFYLDVVL